MGMACTVDQSREFARVAAKDGRGIILLQNRFPLNLASSARAARDKWISKCLLAEAGLPVSAGQVFNRHHPWDEIFLAFHAQDGRGIIKPRKGGRGECVFLCTTPGQVAFATAAIFQRFDGLLMETVEYGREFRVLVLDSEPLVCVERFPLEIRGDGKSTPRERIQSSVPRMPRAAREQVLFAMSAGIIRPDEVLAEGEVSRPFAAANGPGSTVREHPVSGFPALCAVAVEAVSALNLRYAGVDIIVRSDSEKPVIIEVNSAPAIECDPAAQAAEDQAVEIFRKLILASFR
jgi:glutamate--cysteine ligase